MAVEKAAAGAALAWVMKLSPEMTGVGGAA
jgi:hypothetical protein